jgi:hypothetical protein
MLGSLAGSNLSSPLQNMAISTIGRAVQDRALRSLSYSISSRDQFIVGAHGRTKALFLTLEGLENGHVCALRPPWGMLFFGVPLGHSEDMGHQDLGVQLIDRLIEMSPQELRWIMDFSAERAREHRDVIRRFGRHPHRNELLGRQSTTDELESFPRVSLHILALFAGHSRSMVIRSGGLIRAHDHAGRS